MRVKERKRASAAAHRQRQHDLRQRRPTAKKGKGILGLGTFVLVSAAVLVAAGYFLWPAVRPSGSAPPGVLTVQVTMEGFYPPRIETRAGQPITLRLVNKDSQFHTDGGGWHQFAIDELRLDVKVPPETTMEYTFTPGLSGDYQFYCSVCCGGKENPYMLGTLAVVS